LSVAAVHHTAKDTAQGGNLLVHLLRFGDLLRLMGVETSLRQMLDLVDALEFVPISQRADFYYAAKSLLITHREDLPIFDQAFALFWNLERDESPNAEKKAREKKQPRLPSQKKSGEPGEGQPRDAESAPDASGDETNSILSKQIGVYSPLEVIRQKDFRDMTWEEIQAAKRAMAQLDWKLGLRRTRRYRSGPGGRLDLRRLVRDNLRFGGEPLKLTYRMRVYHPRPLVVLCDISGSMERYSRMLLHFVHALTHGRLGVDVEAFVFSTRLTRITQHLRHRDVDESLDELGLAIQDWSGGTRIGEAIKAFNFDWARRVLGRGAVVLIISDGWDRGDSRMLAREMARLQRSAHRLIWLNPLLGSPAYEPTQRGMATALGCIDDFLPGCNLASLEQMAGLLSSVTLVRPERKQHVRPPIARSEPKFRPRRSNQLRRGHPGSPLHAG
jgi:uncharacterized protein